MPEVLRLDGFVFFFYSNEGNEPMHVHIRKAGGLAKYRLLPIELDYSKGRKSSDLFKAEKIIYNNFEEIKEKWDNVFGSQI